MRPRSVTHYLRLVAGAVLICLGALIGTASAQYHIDMWTTEQGLPQSSVGSVAQTPDGFIWATTKGGLVRFDGVRFRVYDTATNPELPNSRLAGLFADESGSLWVTTDSFELLRFRAGTFQKVGPADGFPSGEITRSFRMGRGWLIRTRTGAAIIEKNGQIVPDTHPGMRPALGLRPIGVGPGDVRWFDDAAGLAYRYDGARLTRTVTLPADRAEIVFEDRTGRLWMSHRSSGLLISLTGDVVHRYGPKDGVPTTSYVSWLEEPDGTIWFGESGGLLRFRDGTFRLFQTTDGLPSNQVGSVFRDREGSLWVATQGGLARFVEPPITTYSVAQGLAAKNTYPILQDRRGDIWIGGWPGLTRYRNGVFENMSKTVDRGVLSLAETRDGTIWVGLSDGGVRRLTIDGAEARITATALRRPNVANAIYETKSGDVWLGAIRGAFRWHDGVMDEPLPQTADVSAFYEDDRGTLWIGSAAGLARYANGVLTQVGANDGFTGQRVRMIYPGADGTLWFGTYDSGLFRYRDGRFTRYTTAEGLPTNGAFQILEDAQARFWISSNSGIYRVAISELDAVAEGRLRRVTAVRYGKDDGMLNQECNGLGRPAGIRAHDGKMWFPTQDGVVVIDPQNVGRLAQPPVTILDAAVDGVSVPLDRIEIRSGSRALDVRYAALTYVRSELASFRYRMEGLEEEWHDDTGSDRTARYAQLPYGNFTFRVIAANREGVWNEAGASIPVIVVPPFWRTTWFMSLAFLSFVAAGFGTHRVRLGVIEKERARQEAFARQLLDSQETDRRRIASELHDGVSQTLVVMRNWARRGGEPLSEEAAARRLDKIEGAAAQALGEVREVVQDLVPYHLERVGLAEAIRDAAQRVADATSIAITCACADLTGALTSETSLRLFRVAQEGLNNVVKHSGAREAWLEITRDSAHVRLTLRDNGKGFVPGSTTPTVATGGFGLVGMAERAKMMGGEMTIDSAPGKGTTIIITVPTAPAAPAP